jgi:hypothetical protein
MTEDELRASFRRRRAERPSLQAVPPPAETPAPMEVLDAELSPNHTASLRAQGIDCAQASRAVALRLLGYSITEISDEMHVPLHLVNRWLHHARSAGRLSDVSDRLKNHVAAMAADKLELMVENGDKEAVLEALKGTGYLKSGPGPAGDGRGDGAINLQVTVELPVGVRSVADIPMTGQIAGSPLEIADGKSLDDGEGETDSHRQ